MNTLQNQNNKSSQFRCRCAAIDVGSNAIRMVIADYISKESNFEEIEKYRIPLRLGADVFNSGKISLKSFKTVARGFQNFAEQIKIHQVEKVKAVGTSALREAINQKTFIEFIHNQSGIKIETIDSLQEAQLIFLAIEKKINLKKSRSLLMDIGGGSLELSCIVNGKMHKTQSIPFGPLRILEVLKKNSMSEKEIPALLEPYIQDVKKFFINEECFDFMVGTGGNFEVLKKISSLSDCLSIKDLEEALQGLSSCSLEKRIELFNLKSDRADVIIAALQWILLVIRIIPFKQMDRLLIPSATLKEGLLWSMIPSYERPIIT